MFVSNNLRTAVLVLFIVALIAFVAFSAMSQMPFSLDIASLDLPNMDWGPVGDVHPW